MWTDLLDERQRKEVEFARLYAAQFSHGTDGHNRLLLIATMASLLDVADRNRLLAPAVTVTQADLDEMRANPRPIRKPQGTA